MLKIRLKKEGGALNTEELQDASCILVVFQFLKRTKTKGIRENLARFSELFLK